MGKCKSLIFHFKGSVLLICVVIATQLHLHILSQFGVFSSWPHAVKVDSCCYGPSNRLLLFAAQYPLEYACYLCFAINQLKLSHSFFMNLWDWLGGLADLCLVLLMSAGVTQSSVACSGLDHLRKP